MPARRAALTLLSMALAVLAVLPVPRAAAAEFWLVRQLTHDSVDHGGVDVSGDRVAWWAEPGSVSTWKAGDGHPTTLTAGPRTYCDTSSLLPAWRVGPRVYRDGVAWVGEPIFATDPLMRIVGGGVHLWRPAFRPARSHLESGTLVRSLDASGDRLAWMTDSTPTMHSLHWFRVYTFHQGTLSLLDTTRGGPPAVSGDRLAWWAGGTDEGAVYTWTASSRLRLQVSGTIPAAGGNFGLPADVSGERVAWHQVGECGTDVYTCTPCTGPLAVTTDGGDKSAPEVSGDRIVWSATDGTRSDVYTWTPARGVRRLSSCAATSNTSPRVSGDRVVWVAGPEGRRQVYTWTPSAGLSRVTRGLADDADPAVSGNRIAWRRKAPDGTYQVMTATPWRRIARLRVPWRAGWVR